MSLLIFTTDGPSPFFAKLESSKEPEPSVLPYFQQFEHQPSPQSVANSPGPTNYQTFQSEELATFLSPAPLIQYSPTRRFSHVEVTGLPHHRITTKRGLKITPLPSSKSRGKQPIRLDNSGDDLYLRSPSRTPQFEVPRKQRPNARGMPSSRFGKTQDYEESFSVKRSKSNVYDLESEDSDEYLDEETIPWSQSQTHKRRRLNGSPSKPIGKSTRLMLPAVTTLMNYIHASSRQSRTMGSIRLRSMCRRHRSF
jgi:hypothetical protein